jgi:hypothetical protein
MTERILIGVDPGRHTGLAFFDPDKKTFTLSTLKIHQAFEEVLKMQQFVDVEVTIENPNLWTHFKDTHGTMGKVMGAGSIKRDYSAWVDFLEDKKIPFKSVRPDKTRNKLAKRAVLFKRITNYKLRCSEHARVAAMLVWK